jgi:hypothetical protein
VRRLLLIVVAALAVVGCSGDDDASEAADTSAPPTTTTTPVPSSTVIVSDDTFEAADVEALCADLGGLADIDPSQDPTQADVDRLRAIATTAPEGVAEPLGQVADYGQAIVDGGNGGQAREAAVGAVTILIAYGNEVCGINVPLFNSIAGV